MIKEIIIGLETAIIITLSILLIITQATTQSCPLIKCEMPSLKECTEMFINATDNLIEVAGGASRMEYYFENGIDPKVKK